MRTLKVPRAIGLWLGTESVTGNPSLNNMMWLPDCRATFQPTFLNAFTVSFPETEGNFGTLSTHTDDSMLNHRRHSKLFTNCQTILNCLQYICRGLLVCFALTYTSRYSRTFSNPDSILVLVQSDFKIHIASLLRLCDINSRTS